MSKTAIKPVGKPRGRNGGRKPTVDPSGGKLVDVSTTLPQWAADELDATGQSRADAARRIIIAALADKKPTAG
jgi:hypothetical protein